MPTDIFKVSGDPDLATIYFRGDTSIDLFHHAVYEGKRPPPDLPIRLYSSDFDRSDFGSHTPAVLTSCLYLSLGALLLSDEAIAVLGPVLNPAGYFIDTELDAERIYKIFVCERRLDVLDEERAELKRFSTGNIWDVLRYAFHEDRLEGADIFKVKGVQADLLVTDRFVSLVNEHKLRGFEFVNAWNRATGGVRFNPDESTYEAYPGESQAIGEARRRAMREILARDHAERRARERNT